jgi:hypothetical protein
LKRAEQPYESERVDGGEGARGPEVGAEKLAQVGHEVAKHVGLAHQTADVALLVLQRKAMHTGDASITMSEAQWEGGRLVSFGPNEYPSEKIFIRAGREVSSD